MSYSDDFLRDILRETRRIALVGASANTQRASFGVMDYLLAKGFEVLPVNPGLAGRSLLNQTVVPSLAEITQPVELIDIFRNSEAAGNVVDEAITHRQRLGIKTVWMQLGVVNEAAAARATAAGLKVVMDRCPKIELVRLGMV